MAAKNIKKINLRHSKYLSEFLGNYEKLNKSQHTVKNYASDLRRFMHWYACVNGRDILRVNSRDIDKYKDYLAGNPSPIKQKLFSRFWMLFTRKRNKDFLEHRPLSVGSKRRHISAIKNFYEYMIAAYDGKLNGLKDNPVKSKIHSIKLKDSDVEHTKLLTEKDFAILLRNSTSNMERLLLNLLYYGGLRLQEVTNIKISSFSQKNRTISLIRKGGNAHTYKLQNFEEIFSLLVKFLKNRKSNSDTIFLNRFGLPISSRSMYSRINKLFKKSALNKKGLGPHSFRKACATNLYIETKDILLVRNYLGHKDAKVTQTYIEYYQ